MNLYKTKKRRRFLLGFLPTMLLVGIPILCVSMTNEKFAIIGTVTAITIPIIVGILLSKTAKE